MDRRWAVPGLLLLLFAGVLLMRWGEERRNSDTEVPLVENALMVDASPVLAVPAPTASEPVAHAAPGRTVSIPLSSLFQVREICGGSLEGNPFSFEEPPVIRMYSGGRLIFELVCVKGANRVNKPTATFLVTPRTPPGLPREVTVTVAEFEALALVLQRARDAGTVREGDRFDLTYLSRGTVVCFEQLGLPRPTAPGGSLTFWDLLER